MWKNSFKLSNIGPSAPEKNEVFRLFVERPDDCLREKSALAETIDSQKLEKFLIKVIAIERRYAHELKSATSDRRSEIIEAVNSFSGKELENQ